MKKIVVLLLVCLVALGSAEAEFDLETFKSSGGYIVSDNGDVITQAEPMFMTSVTDPDVNVCITFGVMNNTVGGNLYLPLMSVVVFHYPEDFEKIQAICMIEYDRSGDQRETEFALAEPMYQDVTAGTTTIYKCSAYLFMIGSELKTALEITPNNQETRFIFQTESNKQLYFEMTEEIRESYLSFWADCENAGGYTDEELDVVDFFRPMGKFS